MLDFLHRCHLSGYEINDHSRASFRLKELHLSTECWHARCSNQFTRETRDKSHQGGGRGCSTVGVSRKAWYNLKPTHSLLASHRATGLSARMGERPPPRKLLSRSVGVWGQYRTMYGECISCTLQHAIHESVVRWDLMLTGNLFVASHEPWHISGLGSMNHFQTQPGYPSTSPGLSPWRRTNAGEKAREHRRWWIYQRANAKSMPTLCLIGTGRWNCTPRPRGS